jgi:aspartate/methionine/tyrosine aminotransferase
MRQAHVALTPGRDFGRHGSERWVRLSYASAMPQLQEALSRLSHWLAARA